jgi:hypothetical protein
LLRREVPVEAEKPNDDSRADSQHRAAGDSELLTMLRRELDIKNQQITQQSEMLSKQMELISGLSERLREGNILIGSLQPRHTLTDGSKRTKRSVAQADTAKSGVGESSVKMKGKGAPKSASKKRGIFHRFFG